VEAGGWVTPVAGDEVTPVEFFLNFDPAQGVLRPGTAGDGKKIVATPEVYDDGNDVIFGDLGNDWLVGGTGRDHLYGGWGNDLMNVDDDHRTNSEANDMPDTHATYEDLAYGGAGRDVLIANTGGDRLIDWVGEFNSYLVPFAPYGAATISRTLQPQLPEFLYALSLSDGIDPTRAADGTGGDAARNGEPFGELGVVRQKDFAWHDQTGAPDDPQAGNIPGGKRDVLRTATFDDAEAQTFYVDRGTFTVSGGQYQVAPENLGGDALAVFNVDKYIPNYFEMLATIKAVKPVAGFNANAYLVFDYQSATDFKFAGINISTSKLEMGYHDATGWHVVVQTPYTGALKADTSYNVLLALNGNTATMVVENRVTMTHTFAPRIDVDGWQSFLNEGMVGLGANNAKGAIDNVVVQRLAPETTLEHSVTFSGDTGSLFPSSDWVEDDEHYVGTDSIALVNLEDLGAESIGAGYFLDLSATLKTGAQGGFVFDWYGPKDYKFVAVDVDNDQVVLGHSTARSGRVIDAVWNSIIELSSNTDYTLNATLMGTTVSVTLGYQNNEGNDVIQNALSYAFNALVTDGQFGLLAYDGSASFDSFTVKTDDPAFAGIEPPPPPPPPPEPDEIFISVSDALGDWKATADPTEVKLTFTLSAASDSTVTVDYKTADGTATVEDGDYLPVETTTLSFAPGQTVQEVWFTVYGDTNVELDEIFNVVLSNAVGADHRRRDGHDHDHQR
jgi:hypothetical protein